MNEDEQVEIQLGQRISQLENQIDADEKSISMLQTQWERVVGEIWKCGVQILGKEEMGKFLVAGNAVDGQEKDEEGASLFVPEHGDAEQKRHQSKKGSKKRVKFGDPEKELPEFITHVRKGEGVPAAPEVPVREVREMEKRIESLGVKRIEELKRLNEEQDAWYRKKTQQLLTVWQADV